MMITNNDFKNNLHLTMQGKGGIGKSFISWLMSQYIKSYNLNLAAFDTDPVNPSLSSINNLNARYIETVEEIEGQIQINSRKFDDLVNIICDIDNPVLMDIGASNYIPVYNYLNSNDVFSIMKEFEKEIFIHVPIVSQPALNDCLKELNQIEKLPHSKIIVWANNYFGDLENNVNKDLQTKIADLKENNTNFLGVVWLKKNGLFTEDLHKTYTTKITIAQALEDKTLDPAFFNMMTRHRLKKCRQEIFEQLDNIFIPNL